MLVLDPPKPPSIKGFSIARKAKINRVEFGDGYSQRSSIGINATPQTGRLTWANLSKLQADELESFFDAACGVQAFEYTLPYRDLPQKWTSDAWDVRPLKSGLLWSVSATLKEEFDLDAGI
jgi:phage-related protein